MKRELTREERAAVGGAVSRFGDEEIGVLAESFESRTRSLREITDRLVTIDTFGYAESELDEGIVGFCVEVA